MKPQDKCDGSGMPAIKDSSGYAKCHICQKLLKTKGFLPAHVWYIRHPRHGQIPSQKPR